MPRLKREQSTQLRSSTSFLPTPALEDEALRMSYRIARGEQGVLSFEPYKSYLLPLWRFRTVPIARESAAALWEAFESYIEREDLVGADMARKFIQMGMTRAKRYANHKGGKKYDRSATALEKEGGSKVQLPKSTGHTGMEEKLEASNIFREAWKQCTADEHYMELKKTFAADQKVWDRRHVVVKKEVKRKSDQDAAIKGEPEG